MTWVGMVKICLQLLEENGISVRGFYEDWSYGYMTNKYRRPTVEEVGVLVQLRF